MLRLEKMFLVEKNVQTASTNRLREAVRCMAEKAISHAQSNMQSDQGMKRKAKVKTLNQSKKSRKAGRPKTERKTQYNDIFGN